MTGLRRRTTCKSNGEYENPNSARVPYEQEQKEVIAKLRRNVKKRNERSTVVLQGIVVFSALTQVVFLISPSFFLNELPITAARFFILLNFILHANLLLALSPELERWMETRDPGFHFSEEDAWLLSYFSVIAPVISLVSWRSFAQTTWWSATALMSASVRTGLRGIREGERSVADLEKLKNEAKARGA